MAIQRMGTGRGGGFSARSKVQSGAVTLTGLEELIKMSRVVAPRVAVNLARNTVTAIAAKMRQEMRSRAPKDQGTLRAAIHSVRRRGRPDNPVAEVRVGHGKGATHDAFYWHMVEWGTTHSRAQPFVQPTIDSFTPQIPKIFREEFGKRLEKRLAAEARKMGVRT